MKIRNMTGHDIDIEGGIKIPSHGMIRANQSLDVQDRIQTEYGEITIGKSVYTIPTLPEKQEGQMIIVSNVICKLCNDRDDLYMPWGKSYNKDGSVCAKGLQKNPYLIDNK